MEKRRVMLLALMAIAVAAVAIMTLSGSGNADCASIGEQASRDDCYHSLAHSTGNTELCNNITNPGERGHCLGHVPE